jgi:predicted nucleic acid-binding protein
LSPRTIVDTGPLVALLDRKDRYHGWVKSQLESIAPPLDTCEAVLSEAAFLLGHVPGGPQALLELVAKGLVTVSFSLQEEARTIQQLLLRYANVPMSLADACLVRLTEIHSESLLLTLDSDFQIYRRHRRSVIPILLPDS